MLEGLCVIRRNVRRAWKLKLSGTQEETIYEWFTKLLDDAAEYEKMVLGRFLERFEITIQ